jgi:hypothetical protein
MQKMVRASAVRAFLPGGIQAAGRTGSSTAGCYAATGVRARKSAVNREQKRGNKRAATNAQQQSTTAKRGAERGNHA